jgi:hypothetical protein
MNTIAIIFLAFAPGVFVVTTVCAAALLCRRFDKRDADVAAVCDRRWINTTTVRKSKSAPTQSPLPGGVVPSRGSALGEGGLPHPIFGFRPSAFGFTPRTFMKFIRFTLYLPALVAIAGCGILSGAFGLIELDARCQSAWLELRRRVEGHQSAIGNRQS